MKIRPYQSGDARRISELFTRHSPYLRDAAFWLWINRTLPTRPSIVVVAEDRDGIVGHYGVVPLEFEIEGRPVLGGLGLHAFVAPAARQSVAIFEISHACYQLAAEQGLAFIYGFPNQNYRLIQEKLEKWQRVAQFRAWRKPVHQASPLPQGTRVRTFNPGSAEDLLDMNDLLDRLPREGRVGLRSTLGWWDRRYLKHPQVGYQFHRLDFGQEEVAVTVTKIYHPRETTGAWGHLIDFAKSPGVSSRQLLATLPHLFSSEVTELVHWPCTDSLRDALDTEGYSEDGFESFLGVKVLRGCPDDVATAIRCRSNWNLTMGMSDAF